MTLGRLRLNLYIIKKRESVKGWTQAKFAVRSKCLPPYLTDLKVGRRPVPTLPIGNALAAESRGYIPASAWSVKIELDDWVRAGLSATDW